MEYSNLLKRHFINYCINKQLINQFCKGLKNLEEIAQLYGYNITIPDKSTIKILIDNVLSPFYLFQACSVTSWLIESDTYYAIVILLSSLISIVIYLRETKMNFKRLREMSAQNTMENHFRKQNKIKIENESLIISHDLLSIEESCNSNDILPGHLFEVQNDWIVPCECILLNESAILNESMLTGESIPIFKTYLPYNSNIYNPQDDSKTFTLYAGTKCIETRRPEKGKIPILALATQTEFSTIKGGLVIDQFYTKINSLLFLIVLSIMAFIGQLIVLPNTISFAYLFINWSFICFGKIIKKNRYTVSICKQSYELNQGRITIRCFDQTSTLTKDDLDLYGVRAFCCQQQFYR